MQPEKDYHKLYWQVAKARQPGNDINMSTGEALRILGDIISHTGPMNPLNVMALDLQRDIIHQDNVTPGKPLPTTATVLAFPSSKKKED